MDVCGFYVYDSGFYICTQFNGAQVFQIEETFWKNFTILINRQSIHKNSK